MTYAELERLCQLNALRILGGLHLDPQQDADLSGYQTLVLLGPDEPAFWEVFKGSKEYRLPKNPMDHWSKRVIGGLAETLGGKAIYPSDGPPYPPFFIWATRSGRCHGSPINLLVHDEAGLMVSFRGALALHNRLDLPEPPAKPCDACVDRPCLSSCPVDALTPEGYDVDRCKSHIRTGAGRDCMQGCKARLACPTSKGFGRLPEQSEFHMHAFLGPESP